MKIHIERLLQLLQDNADYFAHAYATIGKQNSAEYKLMSRNHIHHQLLLSELKKDKEKSDASNMVPGTSK